MTESQSTDPMQAMAVAATRVAELSHWGKETLSPWGRGWLCIDLRKGVDCVLLLKFGQGQGQGCRVFDGALAALEFRPGFDLTQFTADLKEGMMVLQELHRIAIEVAPIYEHLRPLLAAFKLEGPA